MTLHILKSNIINGEAIRKFRKFKESMMKHIRDKLRLHENEQLTDDLCSNLQIVRQNNGADRHSDIYA